MLHPFDGVVRNIPPRLPLLALRTRRPLPLHVPGLVDLLALYEIAIEFRCLPFSSDGTDALHRAVSSYLQSKGNAQMYYNAQLRLPVLADLKVTPSDWLVDG